MSHGDQRRLKSRAERAGATEGIQSAEEDRCGARCGSREDFGAIFWGEKLNSEEKNLGHEF